MVSIDPCYRVYNLFLDSEIDYSKLDKLNILIVKENLPLTQRLLDYISSNNIKFIEFMPAFNQFINLLPSCIEHIYFPPHSKFNQPLTNLPPNLKSLIIGGAYTHKLEFLPLSLMYLGYHKTHAELQKELNRTITEHSILLQDLIYELPFNIKILSISVSLKNCINWEQSQFNKHIKIIKNGNRFPETFIDLIRDAYNIDYFISVM